MVVTDIFKLVQPPACIFLGGGGVGIYFIRDKINWSIEYIG